MAKIYGRLGQIVRLLKTKAELEQYGEPADFDDVIEFDGVTNADVINGLDTDWNSHTIDSGVLLRNNNPVTINPPGEEWIEEEKAVLGRSGWKDLGVWSTWEAQQAQDYVNDQVLNEWDQAQIDAYIDENITGTNVTQLRVQVIATLKLLAGNLITMRNILGIIAKVILYIRDILIKRL